MFHQISSVSEKVAELEDRQRQTFLGGEPLLSAFLSVKLHVSPLAMSCQPARHVACPLFPTKITSQPSTDYLAYSFTCVLAGDGSVTGRSLHSEKDGSFSGFHDELAIASEGSVRQDYWGQDLRRAAGAERRPDD